MTKAEFLELLGKAYDFPAYYAPNLDAADEILGERVEAAGEKLSLQPLLAALLAEVPAEEREAVLGLLGDYFRV